MTDAPQPLDDVSTALPRPAAGASAGASAGARISRRGARVLLVDDAEPSAPRVLMVRGHDPHDVSRSFWFTPGGGLEEQESMKAAAVRELAEETGWVLEEHELAGPVWRRTAIFDFASQPYVQYEEIFVGRRADAEARLRTPAEWTAVEQETIDAVRWMSAADLRGEAIEVFPGELRGDWGVFLTWDGSTIDLGEVDE